MENQYGCLTFGTVVMEWRASKHYAERSEK